MGNLHPKPKPLRITFGGEGGGEGSLKLAVVNLLKDNIQCGMSIMKGCECLGILTEHLIQIVIMIVVIRILIRIRRNKNTNNNNPY